MKNSLRLTFLTGTGEKTNLNIMHPYLNVTDAEVAEAMERIINSVVFRVKNSPLTKIYGAELIKIDETKFDV